VVALLVYLCFLLYEVSPCVFIHSLGAGKTENTKKIIQYLAAIAGNVTSGGEHGLLEEQLIQANPLLEALGNAKTTKNDNSSRFGKFISINFGNNSRISGASIRSYLLEKSRVTHQGPGERNFHIFYQLLAEHPNKSSLGLTSSKDYAYITDDSSSDVPSQPNPQMYKETLESLDVLKFDGEDRDTIYQVVASVLHLGMR
jgi:myosin heavy subunit